ncbi:tetratricopeptide repeat protein [Nannocystaceae bacterium ST9]
MSERVAFVRSDGSTKVGSGYVIGSNVGDLVFTAAHVVEGVERCQVHVLDRDGWLGSTVIWRGDGLADVAVLLLDERVGLDPSDEPDWGACGNADLECTAIGYPRFQRQDKRPETEEFVGRLRAGSGLEHKQLNLVHTAPARSKEDWHGISGAALFAEGLLIGIVTHGDTDRLRAWPVARLFDRTDFVAQFGTSLGERLQLDALWPEADHGVIHCMSAWTALARPQNRSPGQLLRANYEVVPFDESLRGPELKQLELFSQAPSSGVLIVTGPGGSGKTRLLLEWCKQMRAEHWLAGFVDTQVLDLRPAAQGTTPRLLVIDYAETQTERIAELIQSMLRTRGRPRTRLVLLARRRGAWVDSLRDDDRIAELLDEYPLLELGALDDVQRHDTYRAAYRAFAGREADASFEVDEDDNQPLLAHMRALLAVLDGPDASLSRAQVLERIVQHERKFWAGQLEQRLGKKPGEALLREADRLGAALVLVDGVDVFAMLPGLARRVGKELAGADVEALSRCFSSLYSRGTRVMGLEPDLLGEQLVLETLKWDEDNRGPEALSGWLDLPFEPEFAGAIGRTLTVLTRLCAERDAAQPRGWLVALLRVRGEQLVAALAAARTETDPPGTTFADAIFATEDMALAEFLDELLPEKTVQLREVAWATASVLVATQRRDVDSDDGKGRLADRLNNLCKSLGSLGRQEDALEASREAVKLYRGLAEARRDAFLPDLAMSLVNLGAMLSSLGRPEEALEATREAVELHRKLAEARPDAFLPDLAASLNNLGEILSSLGKWEDALEATQKAVEFRRELAEARPGTFLPNLATGLNNLGIRLSSLGRREEALEATREAVELHRKLAEARPDAFLPDLAISLNNLGEMLSSLGRLEEAYETTREAVSLRRELAEARPNAFLADLAMSVNNLGLRLNSLGRWEEALEATQEGMELYRELAKARPDAFLPYLARSLSNLGGDLNSLGRRAEALEATREAVELCRELAESSPDAFLPYLATSLINLGAALSSIGAWKNAFEATQEAVELCRKLAEARPDAYLPQLAMSLSNVGNRLGSLGRPEEALEATREAVEVYRELAEARPGVFLPDLARSLNNLGNRLGSLERPEEALEATQEAVELYRELAEARPDVFLPDLALSLTNLGNRLGSLERPEEALEATQEAVELRYELAEARPEVFLPDLATSLGAHGVALRRTGQLGLAALSFAEGLRNALRLVQAQPDAVVHLIGPLARDYREACIDSDTELAEDLAPLFALLDQADPTSST